MTNRTRRTPRMGQMNRRFTQEMRDYVATVILTKFKRTDFYRFITEARANGRYRIKLYGFHTTLASEAKAQEVVDVLREAGYSIGYDMIGRPLWQQRSHGSKKGHSVGFTIDTHKIPTRYKATTAQKLQSKPVEKLKLSGKTRVIPLTKRPEPTPTDKRPDLLDTARALSGVLAGVTDPKTQGRNTKLNQGLPRDADVKRVGPFAIVEVKMDDHRGGSITENLMITKVDRYVGDGLMFHGIAFPNGGDRHFKATSVTRILSYSDEVTDLLDHEFEL